MLTSTPDRCERCGGLVGLPAARRFSIPGVAPRRPAFPRHPRTAPLWWRRRLDTCNGGGGIQVKNGGISVKNGGIVVASATDPCCCVSPTPGVCSLCPAAPSSVTVTISGWTICTTCQTPFAGGSRRVSGGSFNGTWTVAPFTTGGADCRYASIVAPGLIFESFANFTCSGSAFTSSNVAYLDVRIFSTVTQYQFSISGIIGSALLGGGQTAVSGTVNVAKALGCVSVSGSTSNLITCASTGLLGGGTISMVSNP